MIFRPFYYFDRGCASYLVGCGTLSRCAVVDARAEDVDSYMAFASSKNMRITHVIDTHVHADHRSGGPALARRTGAKYCLHESADYEGPFTPEPWFVLTGDTLFVGAVGRPDLPGRARENAAELYSSIHEKLLTSRPSQTSRRSQPTWSRF